MIKWNRKDSKRLLATTTAVVLYYEGGGDAQRWRWRCVVTEVDEK